MRVGILEDDLTLADQLCAWLTSAGHSCFVFHDGQRMIGFLSRETVDLLVIDWKVPGADGIELIRWLRQNGAARPPVLMLTARSEEQDIVTALEAGADEYVVKPVQRPVLLARITALCRLAYPGPAGSHLEQFGDMVFDTRSDSVRIDGELVTLTGKEFALALTLFRNLDRALSRSYIYETVWTSYADLQTRTLDAHISKVRAKLDLRPERGYRIVPVYGYGYRLETVEGGTD